MKMNHPREKYIQEGINIVYFHIRARVYIHHLPGVHASVHSSSICRVCIHHVSVVQ
jgi:hypothetical protein